MNVILNELIFFKWYENNLLVNGMNKKLNRIASFICISIINTYTSHITLLDN